MKKLSDNDKRTIISSIVFLPDAILYKIYYILHSEGVRLEIFNEKEAKEKIAGKIIENMDAIADVKDIISDRKVMLVHIDIFVNDIAYKVLKEMGLINF